MIIRNHIGHSVSKTDTAFLNFTKKEELGSYRSSPKGQSLELVNFRR